MKLPGVRFSLSRNTLPFPNLVTQSEAKSLGGIHVYVTEILRRFAPLDDKREGKHSSG